MKNRWPIVLVLLLALVPLADCDASSSSGSTPQAGPVVSAQESSNVVSATGEVRPARGASLWSSSTRYGWRGQ